MSNGGRCSSARPATTNTSAAGACQISHHGRHASAMPTSDRVPAAMATLLAASTSGSSYASSCAAERIAPSRAYLFALAQPAIRVPRTPTALAASTNSRPASRSAATADGDSGSAAIATRYGTSATAGASRKTGRSAAAGTISSFCTNLTPSAISWAQPWNPPAYIGPSRPCMCAMTLCSVCPTRRGSTRNATSTTSARSTTSSTSPASGTLALRFRRGLFRPAAGDGLGSPGAPAGGVRDARGQRLATARGGVRVGLARLLGARPRLARARRQDERLAQRGALEAVGQEQRAQPVARAVVEAVEGHAEHLEGLALVPRHAGPHLGEAGQVRVGVRDARAEQEPAHGAGPRAAGVGHVQDDVDAGRVAVGGVDSREPVEEVHAELVADVPGGLGPRLAGYVVHRGAGRVAVADGERLAHAGGTRSRVRAAAGRSRR